MEAIFLGGRPALNGYVQLWTKVVDVLHAVYEGKSIQL
jgi:hypothetical protein